jgi:hypothetical protein
MKGGESVGGIANHSPFEDLGKFVRVKKGFGECQRRQTLVDTLGTINQLDPTPKQQQKSEEGLEELPWVWIAIFSVPR